MKRTDQQIFDTKYTVMPSGCWEWQGARQKKHKGKNGKYVKDYGFGTYQKKKVMAHRVSYLLHIGPIPEGKWVMQSCNNPPCCNPAHLFLGTCQDKR